MYTYMFMLMCIFSVPFYREIISINAHGSLVNYLLSTEICVLITLVISYFQTRLHPQSITRAVAS